MEVHSKNDILNRQLSKLQIEFILIDHGLCPDWPRETHTNPNNNVFTERTRNYIKSNIADNLSVVMLAKEMNFNEKYFGTTPARYAKNMRLEAANHELLYSNIPIQLIPEK